MLTVGELSTTRPHAVKVFQRHGIDFCCGGSKSLADACAPLGLAEATVLAEIEVEEARSVTSPRRWDEAPLTELIDHLLVRYHEPMAEDLARLEAMAERVFRVHGHKDDNLEVLLEVVVALREDLEPHLMKEEQVLFPWIRQGNGATAGAPIAMMRHEHDEVAVLLRRARELTNDYLAPDGACATWRALWKGLETFDQELVEHIALENNVLFPRALAR